MSSQFDHSFMTTALALAARGLGDTWPNPAVGCVIVKDGTIVGRGWTQSGGRPHAETEALRRAGSAAKGATAYVSLEPCSHHGKTPPCADALIAAGITRVVSATTDPDPRVSGQGLAALRAAGIEVVEGVGKAEADKLNAGFFNRVTKQQPLFALKTATSLDGRIALAGGESKWITGEQSRHAVQALRAQFDAILVGSETVLQDDPDLTCRLAEYGGRPKVRIVLDRRLRTSVDCKLIQTAKSIPTWIYTAQKLTNGLSDSGAEVITLNTNPSPRPSPLRRGEGEDYKNQPSPLMRGEGAERERGGEGSEFITGMATDLAAKGITRVLIEGGGQVAAAFLKVGIISDIYWFRGAQVLGGDARPGIAGLGLDQLAAAPHFKRGQSLWLGQDFLEILSQ